MHIYTYKRGRPDKHLVSPPDVATIAGEIYYHAVFVSELQKFTRRSEIRVVWSCHEDVFTDQQKTYLQTG